MKPHLITLLAGELASVILGVALFGIGIADLENDDYGLVLGFVGIFNGLALLLCFVTYAAMLRSKQVFPRILIGYSIGMCVICLQSVFVWAGFQTQLFENYTEKIFDMAVEGGKQIEVCSSFCLTGVSSIFDTLIDDTTQDYELEKAGAGVAVFALISQAVIIVSSFMMLRDQPQETDMSDGVTESATATPSSDGYAPAPENDLSTSLSANL